MGQVEAIIDGFASGRQGLEARIQKLVIADLTQVSDWYSPQQVAAVTKLVAQRLTAGQMGMAQLTDSYLARVTSFVVGKATVGGTVPAVMGKTLRHGVKDHEQVYARVAAEYRYQRSLGLSDGDALGLAFTRAQSMVSTDMGLAFQHQTQRFMEKNRINYYRRVIRPEMSKSGTCALCAAASDRIYRKQNLLPIHAHCKCAVICVTAKSDPGSQLNDDTLQQLYNQAGSTYGVDLKKVRVHVFDHPELGPQLRVEGQNIRDLAA